MHHTNSADSSASAELVKKIGTSASSPRKRRSSTQAKIKEIAKQHKRFASTNGMYAVAVTLTYAHDSSFAAGHMTRFIDCLRDNLERTSDRLPYVWVLERANRLHYHLTVWLPIGMKLTRKRMESWWPWGTTWTERCNSTNCWVKYMNKNKGKTMLPKGAHSFGSGGLDDLGKLATRRAALPLWLRKALPSGAIAIRIIPGWVDPATGEVYVSPYAWTPHGYRLRSELAKLAAGVGKPRHC